MATKTFNPSASHSCRAVQAWQILVSMAMHRQTATYEGLSRLMYGKNAAGVLNQILGHVAFFCKDNKLPPLTSVVVGKERGTPGEGIPLDPATLDQQREQVYQHDWYDVRPPSAEELAAAYSRHAKEAPAPARAT